MACSGTDLWDEQLTFKADGQIVKLNGQKRSQKNENWRKEKQTSEKGGKQRIKGSMDGHVAWLRRLLVVLSQRRPVFSPRSIHVGFVMDKVALGQGFLRVIRFSPVSIIPPSLSELISGEWTMSVSGSSSEMWSHPVNKRLLMDKKRVWLWTVSLCWWIKTVSVLLLAAPGKLCLTQVNRWHHSFSDVVVYVTTQKVTRFYFQCTSCIHTAVGNSNTLGSYRVIQNDSSNFKWLYIWSLQIQSD
jgi:hypothetical protein